MNVVLHHSEQIMSSPATLSATHLPGQLLELAGIVQAAELADLSEDGAPNNDNVQISLDTETNAVTVTATFPMLPTQTADGIVYTAEDYLP